ncbi:MAG: cytidine deaminase [Parachlamydiales bacterium]|nr:cytidine deaminase [Parachlamydiales bacterium]
MFFSFIISLFIAFSLHAQENQNSSEDLLIQEAVKCYKNAYCPYSHYSVSSALITKEGKIFRGVNVENASYSPTICAERSAVVSAVSAGFRDFQTIVVISRDGKATPCGVCRQVLNEFNPNIRIITADPKGHKTGEYFLDTIFPEAFGPKNLEN